MPPPVAPPYRCAFVPPVGLPPPPRPFARLLQLYGLAAGFALLTAACHALRGQWVAAAFEASGGAVWFVTWRRARRAERSRELLPGAHRDTFFTRWRRPSRT